MNLQIYPLDRGRAYIRLVDRRGVTVQHGATIFSVSTARKTAKRIMVAGLKGFKIVDKTRKGLA